LLLGLEAHLADERRQCLSLERLLDLVDLLLRGLAADAVLARRQRRAHVDRHLGLVAPVGAHGADLGLHEDRGAHERQRDEGDEHDRDDHGEVAAQAEEGLADDESEIHEVGPTSSSSVSESPRRSAMPSSSTCTSGRKIGFVRGPRPCALSSCGAAAAGSSGARGSAAASVVTGAAGGAAGAGEIASESAGATSSRVTGIAVVSRCTSCTAVSAAAAAAPGTASGRSRGMLEVSPYPPPASSRTRTPSFSSMTRRCI